MPRWLSLTLLLSACAPADSTAGPADARGGRRASEPAPAAEALPPLRPGQAEAIFAGGCFWCMEKPFDQVDGVIATTSGYTGGPEQNPTYAQVSSHQTGHREALRVVYLPERVSYEQLLDVFWHNVDPTQADGQFCDRGHQYTSAIYPQTDSERLAAEASREAVAARLGQPVLTAIEPASTFWPAEDYHQDFYRTNPTRYASYRLGCRRDARLAELWGADAGH